LEIFNRVIIAFLLVIGIEKGAFAYDFSTILNDSISLKTSSYYVSDANLTPLQAYELYAQGSFTPLPKEAKSFGRDKREYWFAFEIEKSEQKNFLDIRNISIDRPELFYFIGDSLKNQISLHPYQGDKRVQFSLIPSEKNALYLLKINSKSPKFISFMFGTEIEVERYHATQFSLFSFTSGVFLFTTIFSLFLFVVIRKTSYFYYSLHIFGIYLSIIITNGYRDILPAIPLPILVLFALEIQFIGLVFFSDDFLQLKYYPKLRNKIFAIFYTSVAVALLSLYFPPAHEVFFILTTILFLILFYIAFKTLLLGSRYAKYYLIGTGVSTLFMILYTFTHKGYLPYTFFTFNLLEFALIWESIFLTLAVVSKIHKLQEENLQKERIIKIQTRQDTIGSMMGNIAHQWRSPLSEVGAMVTTLRTMLTYATLSKEENLEYLEKIAKKLTFISQTVDTFQKLTIKDEKIVDFDLSKTCIEIVNLFSESIKNNKITLILEIEEDLTIKGDDNLIAQVVMTLIQNGQEAIVKSKREDGKIIVSLKKSDDKILLQVSDNGVQIEHSLLNKIFEPFFTTKKSGSGIGLYLAKSIIEQNFKGKLELRVDGNEKIFCITLFERK